MKEIFLASEKRDQENDKPTALQGRFSNTKKHIPILNFGIGHDYYFFENRSLQIPSKSSLKPAVLLVKLNFKKLMCEQLSWF